MREEDAQWLAGIVEGEGSIGNYNGCPRIVVKMTDKDVMDRIALLFNSNIYYENDENPNHKPLYTAGTYGKKSFTLAALLQPLLHSRRYDKIAEVYGLEEIPRLRTNDFYVGLVEGEGCWTWGNNKSTPMFALEMCDFDVIYGAKEFFGNIGKITNKPIKIKEHYKPSLAWRVMDRIELGKLLPAFSRKMGNRRQEAINRHLFFLREKGIQIG